ncbi:MAG: YCF48-related protein [Chloroflexi bacterium]|nr:YCF48-related protein [Chloroflexota bacterium]
MKTTALIVLLAAAIAGSGCATAVKRGRPSGGQSTAPAAVAGSAGSSTAAKVEAGATTSAKDLKPGWNVVPSPSPNDLLRVSFFEGKVGWIVGANGTVLKSPDGGTSWTVQKTGTELDMNSIATIDAKTAIAAGTQGRMLSTTDGDVWAQLNNPAQTRKNLLADIVCLDKTTCWAVGQDGLAIVTTDAGKSWSGRVTGVTNTLNSIYFVDPKNAWAVGKVATVTQTKDGGET